jgi:hypothetical protein
MESYNVTTVRQSLFNRKRMNFDSFWKKAEGLSAFFFPWDDEPPPSLIFRAVHDLRNFYFRFDVIDTELVVHKSGTGKMAVLDSDRVEIFFRVNEHMKPYYCLEMDPAGRVLDYVAEYYRIFNYNWVWEGITVLARYTVNGYRVWGCIPLTSLKELGLLNEGRIQAGLFRGKCIAGSGSAVTFKWISWQDPKTAKPDFHVPESFGELILGD